MKNTETFDAGMIGGAISGFAFAWAMAFFQPENIPSDSRALAWVIATLATTVALSTLALRVLIARADPDKVILRRHRYLRERCSANRDSLSRLELQELDELENKVLEIRRKESLASNSHPGY